MWSVEFESKDVEKAVLKLKLTDAEKDIVGIWIRQIKFHGPESIESDSKWNDHALFREWKGYRSSSFSNRGRIIYRVIENKVLISIAKITKTHDYTK